YCSTIIYGDKYNDPDFIYSKIVCKLYVNYLIVYTNQKLILDKRRPKKSGLFPLKIRVTFHRIQKYYPLGIDLTESDFERVINGSVRKELRELKIRIAEFEVRVRSIIDSMEVFSFHELKNQLGKNFVAENDVYLLFDNVIEQLSKEGRIGSASAYKDARNSFQLFRSKLTFHEISVDFLKDFEISMKKRNISSTTTGIYLRHLRAIFNKAIEAGIIDQHRYPFGKNKFQIKSPRNIKKALTLEQIKKIIDFNVKVGSNQHLSRDMWVLSYLCNGMNIKDILNLKFKNLKGDTLHYDRSKTSNTIQNPKPIIISLLPKAKEILERWGNKDLRDNSYVFPVFHNNLNEKQKQQVKHQFIKTINKYMKLIGGEIGYDKPLTTYAARHSFATVLKRSGAPMELISESLGHKSLHTTEAYLDSFEDQTRRKFMENLIPK
ncbi:MAG: site-specific integrase, partial [Cyclobacteriaceae bacterium]|nr:site-specific integrase [Cyclobacteriaceae bacterium]